MVLRFLNIAVDQFSGGGSEVINLTDGNNELILIGDSNDSVTATGFVDTGKDQSIDGRSFSIYEAGTATLFIDDEIGTITLT